MKRSEIRDEVERHLSASGFGSDAWVWNRSELIVAVGGVLRRIKMKAGISKRALQFELGRISGWAEISGLTIKVFNAPGEWIKPHIVAEAA